MNCEDAMKLTYASVDGPISPGDEEKLTAHLQGCEECRTEFRRLNRLEDVLRSIPEPPVSKVRLEETVSAVSAEVRGRGRARGVGVWIAVAATILIAVGVGFLFGRRRATPSEGMPGSEVPELAVRGADLDAAREDGPIEVAAGAEEAAPRRADLLVERLVQADLALSEADGPGHKAVIFCGMSRDVLAELRESVSQSDVERVRVLGQGYTRLVRDGVLPSVKLASGEEDRERVSQVMGSLKGNCEVLGSLAAGIEDPERTLLAEALSVSEECLRETEGKLGL